MVPLRYANLDDASVHECPDLLDASGPSGGNHIHALVPGNEAPPGELTAAGEEERQPAIGKSRRVRFFGALTCNDPVQRALALDEDLSRFLFSGAKEEDLSAHQRRRSVSSLAVRRHSEGARSPSESLRSSHCTSKAPERKSGSAVSRRKSGRVVSTPVISYSESARESRAIACARSLPKTTSLPSIGS